MSTHKIKTDVKENLTFLCACLFFRLRDLCILILNFYFSNFYYQALAVRSRSGRYNNVLAVLRESKRLTVEKPFYRLYLFRHLKAISVFYTALYLLNNVGRAALQKVVAEKVETAASVAEVKSASKETTKKDTSFADDDFMKMMEEMFGTKRK